MIKAAKVWTAPDQSTKKLLVVVIFCNWGQLKLTVVHIALGLGNYLINFRYKYYEKFKTVYLTILFNILVSKVEINKNELKKFQEGNEIESNLQKYCVVERIVCCLTSLRMTWM